MSGYKFNVGDRVTYIGPFAGREEDEGGTVTGFYGALDGGHPYECLLVRWDADGCTCTVQRNNVVKQKQFPQQNPDELTVGEFKKILEQYADGVVMSKALSEIFNRSY